MGCACSSCCQKCCCCGSFEKSAAKLPEPFKTIALRMNTVSLHSDVQMDLAAIADFASHSASADIEHDIVVVPFLKLVWKTFASRSIDASDDYWLCTLDACVWMLINHGPSCSDESMQKWLCGPHGIAVMVLRKAKKNKYHREVLRDMVTSWVAENEVLAKDVTFQNENADNFIKKGDVVPSEQELDLAKVRFTIGQAEHSGSWWKDQSSHLTLNAVIRISAAQGCLSGTLASVADTLPAGETRVTFFRSAIVSVLWTFGSELLWKIGDKASDALRNGFPKSSTSSKDNDLLDRQALVLIESATSTLKQWFEGEASYADPVNEIARSAPTFGIAKSSKRIRTETASIASRLQLEDDSSEDSGSRHEDRIAVDASQESPRGYVFIEQALLLGLQSRASTRTELQWASSGDLHLQALRRCVAPGGTGRNSVVDCLDQLTGRTSKQREEMASSDAEAAQVVEVTGHASEHVTSPFQNFEMKLREIFNLCDRNHDGHVSMSELILACRKDEEIANFFQVPHEIHQEDGTRDAFMRVYQGIDTDDSKSIEWHEFFDFFMRRAGDRLSRLIGRSNPMLAGHSSGEASDAEPSEVADAPLPSLPSRQVRHDIQLLLSKGLVIQSEEIERFPDSERQTNPQIMLSKELEFGESSADEASESADRRLAVQLESSVADGWENTALEDRAALHNSTVDEYDEYFVGKNEGEKTAKETTYLLERSEEMQDARGAFTQDSSEIHRDGSDVKNRSDYKGLSKSSLLTHRQYAASDPRHHLPINSLTHSVNAQSQQVWDSALAGTEKRHVETLEHRIGHSKEICDFDMDSCSRPSKQSETNLLEKTMPQATDIGKDTSLKHRVIRQFEQVSDTILETTALLELTDGPVPMAIAPVQTHPNIPDKVPDSSVLAQVSTPEMRIEPTNQEAGIAKVEDISPVTTIQSDEIDPLGEAASGPMHIASGIQGFEHSPDNVNVAPADAHIGATRSLHSATMPPHSVGGVEEAIKGKGKNASIEVAASHKSLPRHHETCHSIPIGGAGPLPPASFDESGGMHHTDTSLCVATSRHPPSIQEEASHSMVAAPHEVLIEVGEVSSTPRHTSNQRSHPSVRRSLCFEEPTQTDDSVEIVRGAPLHQIVDDITALWNQVDAIYSILDNDVESSRSQSGSWVDGVVAEQPTCNESLALGRSLPPESSHDSFGAEKIDPADQNANHSAGKPSCTSSSSLIEYLSTRQKMRRRRDVETGRTQLKSTSPVYTSRQQIPVNPSKVPTEPTMDNGLEAHLRGVASELVECRRELQAQQVNTAILANELRASGPSRFRSQNGAVTEIPSSNITSTNSLAQSSGSPTWPAMACIEPVAANLLPVGALCGNSLGTQPREFMPPEVVPWDTPPALAWTSNLQANSKPTACTSPLYLLPGRMQRTMSELNFHGMSKIRNKPSTNALLASSPLDNSACLMWGDIVFTSSKVFDKEMKDMDQKVQIFDRNFRKYFGCPHMAPNRNYSLY